MMPLYKTLACFFVIAIVFMQNSFGLSPPPKDYTLPTNNSDVILKIKYHSSDDTSKKFSISVFKKNKKIYNIVSVGNNPPKDAVFSCVDSDLGMDGEYLILLKSWAPPLHTGLFISIYDGYGDFVDNINLRELNLKNEDFIDTDKILLFIVSHPEEKRFYFLCIVVDKVFYFYDFIGNELVNIDKRSKDSDGYYDDDFYDNFSGVIKKAKLMVSDERRSKLKRIKIRDVNSPKLIYFDDEDLEEHPKF